ncbi:aspartate kinase [Candidatus Hydrogenedentota bacterium]
MGLIVQKYGGTSVGDAEKIKNVAARVAKARSEGNGVVVVVSAMGKTTDYLVDLAHEIAPEPSAREFDMLLSTGEQVSIALLAMALHAIDVPAISFTGGQVGILTDEAFSKARILSIDTERIKSVLDNSNVAIVAGFQGITTDMTITTLGRGGSDTTAVALTAALEADCCEIFTDVDGVYTADPRAVPTARKLSKISYDEILELASLGAQVLHPRAVELAKKYDVRLSVRPSHSEGEGTMIVQEVKEMEKVVVSGIASQEDEAKISLLGVPDTPGVAASIFSKIADENICIDMIAQSAGEEGHNNISFTVLKSDLLQTKTVVEALAKELSAHGCEVNDEVAKVSIVGVGMRSHSGIASKMFNALAQIGANIEMISTSEIKTSCLIDAHKTKEAVKAIHAAFIDDNPDFELL